MPKIESLNQNNRLQVGSPVPIRGAESARIAGEGIQDFGQNLNRAAVTMMEVQNAARADDERIELERISETAEKAARESAHLSKQDYNPDEDKTGLGLFESYSTRYREKVAPLIDGLSGDLKAKAANILLAGENSQANDIYDTTAAMKADMLKRKNDQAFNEMSANVYANPYSVVEKIAKSDMAVNDLQLTYGSAAKETIKVERQKKLSITAVQGLIAKNGFDEAQKMVEGPLAKYLGEDVAKISDSIRSAKMDFLDSRQKQTREAEERSAKSAKEQQDYNAGLYFAKMGATMDPAQKEELRMEMYKLVASGQMTREAVNAAQSEGRETMGFTSNNTYVNYVNKITSKAVPADINSQIIRDIKVGLLEPNDGASLMKMVNSNRAREKTGTDPAVKRDLKLAMDAIKVANKGTMDAQIGEIIVPGSMAKQSLEMQLELNNLVDQGMRPMDAANVVIRKFNGDLAATKFIPGIAPQEQSDYATLQANTKKIRRAISELAASGRTKEAADMAEIYEQRMQILKSLETKK
jgi:hypothetical protein